MACIQKPQRRFPTVQSTGRPARAGAAFESLVQTPPDDINPRDTDTHRFPQIPRNTTLPVSRSLVSCLHSIHPMACYPSHAYPIDELYGDIRKDFQGDVAVCLRAPDRLEVYPPKERMMAIALRDCPCSTAVKLHNTEIRMILQRW